MTSSADSIPATCNVDHLVVLGVVIYSQKKKISSHDTVVISGEDRIQQPSHVLRMTVLTQELHVAEVLAGSDLVL
jgi:hypothetical protein